MARFSKNFGFTLIEVLVVIAVLGGIVGLAIPFYQSFQVGSQLDNTTQELVGSLRRSQMRAMASDAFSSHGVHFSSGVFVVFQGVSYNPADILNEESEVPGAISITPSMGADIIFSAVHGETSNSGTITINATNGESRSIIINEIGVVDAD